MEIFLDELRIGVSATVTRIDCSPTLRQRLAQFGLAVGTRVQSLYRSPDGTLTALSLRGITLAVRRETLRQIAVQPL